MHMDPFQIQIWSDFANDFATPLIPMDSTTHQKHYFNYTTSLHDQQIQMNFHAFKCIRNSSINQMEFEFAFQMQYTPFKWNAQHISTLNITITVLFMYIKSQFPLSLAYACLGDHLV